LQLVSRSIGGKYLYSVKGKLFSLAPESGEASAIMERGFAGLVEGAEASGRIRVLESAGGASGFGGRPLYRVLEFLLTRETPERHYIFKRPVLFSVSAGEKGVVGVAPSSKWRLEVLLSEGKRLEEKTSGLVPSGWDGGEISWALSSRKPRFLSLAFNLLGSENGGRLKAFLMVVDLEGGRSFSFMVKYRPPRVTGCPGPALAMGWYGGRYLLIPGMGGRWIDAEEGKFVEFEKVRDRLGKRDGKIGPLETIGNFLVFCREDGVEPKKSQEEKLAGLFLLGKEIRYADGEEIEIPKEGKKGKDGGSRFSISPGGRFALVESGGGKRLWLVDGEKKKVCLLGEKVFRWGWIK